MLKIFCEVKEKIHTNLLVNKHRNDQIVDRLSVDMSLLRRKLVHVVHPAMLYLAGQYRHLRTYSH